MKYSIGAIAASSVLFGGAHSYQIDASCTGDTQTAALVRSAVQSAFGMSQTSLDALNNEQNNQDVTNVLKWLFLRDSDTDTSANALADVQRSLTGINSMSAEVTTGDPDWTDVRIYCDMSRFDGNERDDGQWYDPDIQEVIDPKNTDDVDWQDCKSKLPTTFAYTHNPKGMKFSQIQICPWFLNYAKGKEYNTWEDVQKKTKVLNFAVPVLSSKGWPLTEIDAISLFDKVLLHELTHTRSGGGTKDVGGGNPLFFGGARYGWNQCKALAKKGPDPNAADQAPQRNADSIALLGSAMRFLHLQDNPMRVKENGKLETINQNTKRWLGMADPLLSYDKRFAEPGRFVKVVKAGASM